MGPDGVSGAWTYLIPIIAIVVIVLRGVRTRALRIERMWITPALILLTVMAAFAIQPPPRFIILIAEFFALGVGSGIGWWRGRTTQIILDPETRALSSKASPIGMALIAGVFLLRIAFRDYATAHAGDMDIAPIEVADVLLLFAAGLVCVQRVEMWIRARKLLNESPAPTA